MVDPILPQQDPAHSVTSDVSVSWGCRTVTDVEHFQVQCPQSWSGTNITTREIVPVIISALSGLDWAECTLLVRLDNISVVHDFT